jgi:eukaryotic-like serine/threonine-protein kinase
VAVPHTIGRYEILGSIGSGGMGTLLRARDPKIGGRTVAIKLLKEGIDNDEIRRRFMQEANAAGVLEHENIVRIFDVGEQDGEPFIAMEYIDGETLSQWIRRKEPASVVRKLRLLEELCDGLAYAHSFSIVHRDIKPANLMVEKRRGRLKILDFGIAKLADSGITNAGALIGSFNYMSPEQVRGLPIDHRSDIFSCGAVMFELLSYKQAFPGGLGDGVLGRIAEQPAPRLRQVVPDADPEVEQIINKALEKDPGRRYPDLPAMHRDLTRVRRRLERDEGQSGEHTRLEHEPHGSHTPTGTPKPSGKTGPEAERFARIRAEQVAQHLDAAMKAFEAGRFEEAIDFTYRASAVDEDDPKPRELRTRAQAALDEHHADQHLADAQAALGRGDIEAADALVAKAIEVRPGHTGIGAMREAVARARNQVALAAVMQRARTAIERADWTGAIRATAEAELYQPGMDEARQIRQRAQAAIDEQAARERARQERIRDAVEGARRAIIHGALEEAQAFADQAARDRADTRILENLRTEIELARHQAESAARRSAQAAALIGEGIAKFNAGEFRAAIVRCDAALRIQPDDPQALDVRRRAQRAIEEDEERQRQAAEAERQRLAAEAERQRAAAEAERRRQAAEAERQRAAAEAERRRLAEEEAREAREQHERAARAEVELAWREVEAGSLDAAVARLERFAPPHDEIARALVEIRAEIAERRAQAEAAARAEREEAARRQAEEQRQREEEQRRAEEEQRAARAARAAALAETSRELASAGQYPQALATLTEATRLDPTNAALQELTRQIRDAKTAHEAAERRARDLSARIAEAESRLAAGDFAKARKSADAAAQIDAQAAGLQAVLARIAEAEARVAQEKAAQQQAAEAARLARERDQKVTALIAKARKAKKPGDALGFLEEAQRLDPQRAELAALLAQRQAELAQKSTTPIPGPAVARVPTPGVTVPERKTGTPLSPALLGGIGAAVLLLVVGLWYFLREPTPPPPGPDKPEVVDPGRKESDQPAVTPSAVKIDTEPWTNVTLTPTGGGKAETCTTPCQLQLAPGEYEVAFENGGITQPHTERLAVPAGQPVDLHRAMPGFDVDRAVSSIVGR